MSTPFNPRPSDDVFFRVMRYAEGRALRNGRDPVEAGKEAMRLYRLDKERSLESIVTEAAGPHLTQSPAQ